jgi:hypothetical protein
LAFLFCASKASETEYRKWRLQRVQALMHAAVSY